MDNKLYKKITSFIKENIFFLLFLILIIVLFNIKLPWSVNTPGGLLNIDKRLSGEKSESTGSFNLTYVSFIQGTIPSVLLSYIVPEWDLVKNSDITLEGEDLEAATKRDEIYLEESISNAMYVAYTKANKSIKISDENNYITFILDDVKTNLKIGDIIKKIDDKDISEYDDLTNIIGNRKIGEIIEFDVIRNNKEISCEAEIIKMDNVPKVGIVISKIYEYDKNPNIEYSHKKGESGSSGGLMMSLAIYNALIEEDITKGLNISGTGTIDINGNVGEIAGVKYKLIGAVKNKSDIFIVPADNYKEAKDLKEKYNYDIKIIKANTFDQVLESLKTA